MSPNEYKCAICGEIFEKSLTEEEAKQQLLKEFGNYDVDDCDLVCDDCYNKHFGHNIQEELEHNTSNNFTTKLFAEVYDRMLKVIEENEDGWMD